MEAASGSCSVKKVFYLRCSRYYNLILGNILLCWKQRPIGKFRYSVKNMSLPLGYWGVLGGLSSRGQTQSTLVKLGNLVKIYLFPSDTKVFPCGISLHPVIISGKMTCEKKTKNTKQNKTVSCENNLFFQNSSAKVCNLITWQKRTPFFTGQLSKAASVKGRICHLYDLYDTNFML